MAVEAILVVSHVPDERSRGSLDEAPQPLSHMEKNEQVDHMMSGLPSGAHLL